jgi:phosphoribosylaminoimidazolecarboxamide formyltransferase/IMP cyclohydrolase
MTEKGNFFEVVVCGSIEPSALEAFKSRSGWGQDVRILEVGEWTSEPFLSVRTLRGGALVQEADTSDPVDWRVVTTAQPSEDESAALRTAWMAATHVTSNAIVDGSADRLLGAGAGR